MGPAALAYASGRRRRPPAATAGVRQVPPASRRDRHGAARPSEGQRKPDPTGGPDR
jgi:hypothetical protein